MRFKDTSIADYAKIRINVMGRFVTTMLIMDALAITLTVAVIDLVQQQLQQVAVSLLIFAAATGVILFFLAGRYVESVTHKFSSIDEIKLEAISRVASRFYFPFVLCLVSNIFLAGLGAVLLVVLLFM